MGVKIRVRFIKATYDNKKEKLKHKAEMLNEGWEIENEGKLFAEFKKSEKIQE